MAHLAFSSNAFKKDSIEDAIAAVARIGYRGIEIMADVPHAYPPSLTPDRVKHLREWLNTLGLSVSNVNAFTLFALGDTYHPSWIEPDRVRREIRIKHTLQCVHLAKELGAATISLQPGGPLIGTNLSRDRASEVFATGLQRVLPLARELGITLAIEPEPGLLIQSAEEYLRFKGTFFPNDKAIRMNCDLGHLFCVGEDPPTVLRRMPEEIAHIHLEDIPKSRVHQHLALGEGAMDFRGVFQPLRDISYAGWITVELYPYQSTPAAVAKMAWDYLKTMG